MPGRVPRVPPRVPAHQRGCPAKALARREESGFHPHRIWSTAANSKRSIDRTVQHSDKAQQSRCLLSVPVPVAANTYAQPSSSSIQHGGVQQKQLRTYPSFLAEGARVPIHACCVCCTDRCAKRSAFSGFWLVAVTGAAVLRISSPLCRTLRCTCHVRVPCTKHAC